MSMLLALHALVFAPIAAPAGPLASNAMRAPTILPAPPTRPALDLGPVLLTTKAEQGPISDLLLLQADKLGANGFVLETKRPSDVYRLEVNRQAQWRKEHPAWSGVADLGAFLVTGTMGPSASATSSTQKVYYRAFRYLKGPAPARDLALADVAEDLRPWFADAGDLEAQLLVAHALLAQGIVDVPGYERLRQALLAPATDRP